MIVNCANFINYGGIALIIGCWCAIISDVLGILVFEGHNPIRQTISQLAHGKYAYIQDIGLVLFGIGIILGAISLYAWKSNDKLIKTGAFTLGFSGVLIAILAEFNDFAGEPGTSIHMALAITIGISLLLSMILVSIVMQKINKTWMYISFSMLGVFLFSSLGFFVIPNQFQGIYERAVVLLVLTWLLGLGYFLINTRSLE